MRNILFVIVLLAIGGAVAFALLKPTSPRISSTPIPNQIQLCQRNQINAIITPEGAAGSIYAKLEMTNTSSTDCHISLGNTIKAAFEATNIVVKYHQQTPTTDFVLASGAKVYSQVHFPNGPQCQSGVAEKKITFLYTNIEFTTLDQTPMKIQACTSASEQTIIDIWPLSKNPIN